MQSDPRAQPIRERLDRFVASIQWIASFPLFRIFSEFSQLSDHSFLLLDTTTHVSPPRQPSQFRFEACWALETNCVDLVHTTWSHSHGPLPSKLDAVGAALHD